MTKMIKNKIIFIKGEEISEIEKEEILKKCLTSEELKKELDIKIENEAKKLKQNLQKRKNNILVTI